MAAPRKNICLNTFGLKIKVKNPWYRTQMARFLNEQMSRQNGYDVSAIRQARSVVLFVLPGEECISGGILSIFSMCRYTREILPDAAVVLVTEAGNKTYAQASWFHTDEKIYRWDQVMDNLQDVGHMVIHIPEYMASFFCDELPEESRRILQNIPDLTINILNQNPEIMPPSDTVQKLFELTRHVTQTLAFREKNIQDLANRYHMPVTTIFSYLDLSGWTPVHFHNKKKLILLSHDKNLYRNQVIKILNHEMPDFELITINNMSFEDYMNKVCKAFAVISFGEGYDGYLLQASIVRTLSFAVYNETFFPNREFLKLKNIYTSYPEMISNIARDIRRYADNATEYYDTISALRRLDADHSEQQLIGRLQRFYRKDYECMPARGEN